MFYKVEKVVRQRKPSISKLILALGVGESFLVPLERERVLRGAATWYNSGRFIKEGKRVTVNKESGGVRCTRLR